MFVSRIIKSEFSPDFVFFCRKFFFFLFLLQQKQQQKQEEHYVLRKSRVIKFEYRKLAHNGLMNRKYFDVVLKIFWLAFQRYPYRCDPLRKCRRYGGLYVPALKVSNSGNMGFRGKKCKMCWSFVCFRPRITQRRSIYPQKTTTRCRYISVCDFSQSDKLCCAVGKFCFLYWMCCPYR